MNANKRKWKLKRRKDYEKGAGDRDFRKAGVAWFPLLLLKLIAVFLPQYPFRPVLY